MGAFPVKLLLHSLPCTLACLRQQIHVRSATWKCVRSLVHSLVSMPLSILWSILWESIILSAWCVCQAATAKAASFPILILQCKPWYHMYSLSSIVFPMRYATKPQLLWCPMITKPWVRWRSPVEKSWTEWFHVSEVAAASQWHQSPNVTFSAQVNYNFSEFLLVRQSHPFFSYWNIGYVTHHLCFLLPAPSKTPYIWSTSLCLHTKLKWKDDLFCWWRWGKPSPAHA